MEIRDWQGIYFSLSLSLSHSLSLSKGWGLGKVSSLPLSVVWYLMGLEMKLIDSLSLSLTEGWGFGKISSLPLSAVWYLMSLEMKLISYLVVFKTQVGFLHKLFYNNSIFYLYFSCFCMFLFVLGGERHKRRGKSHIYSYFKQVWVMNLRAGRFTLICPSFSTLVCKHVAMLEWWLFKLIIRN